MTEELLKDDTKIRNESVNRSRDIYRTHKEETT